MVSEIYVEMKNWADVNWYLQEGYYIGNPNGITFPGFFTLKCDLDKEPQRESLKKIVLSAREKGIKITTNDDKALLRIGLSLEDPGDGEVDIKLLSNGKGRVVSKKEPIDISNPAPVTEEPKTEKDDKEAIATLNARREQLRKCNAFLLRVANELRDTHEIVGSPFKKTWSSACLIPKGTANQLTYRGKPFNSLRVACNWNWRASLKRCPDEKYIQCPTNDLPWCRKRKEPGMASDPIWGNMVGYYDEDKKYHCVFGEKYDRETKTWSWVDGDEKALVAKMRERAYAQQFAQDIISAVSNQLEDPGDEAVNTEVNLDEI